MKAICIDGGASKVAGAIVEQLDSVTFRLYGAIIENRYQDQEGFNHNFSSIDIDLVQSLIHARKHSIRKLVIPL